MDAKAICQVCFLLVLLIGLGCVIFGPALNAAVKAAKLDAVLSPEELTDKKVRDRTQDLIERTAKQYWPVWLGLGLMLVTVSVVGLRAAATIKRTVQ
jgi:hypothetical protein